MPFCPNCGKEIQADIAFCYSCGYNLKKVSSVKQSQTLSPLGNAVIIILAFIGLIAAILLGFLINNAPQGLLKDISASPKTISIYIEDLPYGADPTYSNAVREAKAYWEKRQNVIFKETSSPNEADVTIEWVKEFGGKTLGHTVGKSYIEIGLGDSNCLGKWKPYKYKTVSKLATHELGHILGYQDDYSNAANIMYYKTSISYETDIEESDILSDGGEKFYPVCTREPIATYSIEISSSEPLDIYLLGSLEDGFSFRAGKTFSHYSACQGDEVRLYTRTCTISNESIIALKNPTIFGLGASARYTIKVKEI